jgi:hypothetical protein
MNTATSIPVPKLLWDELENALMIKSKELIYDIAKTLRQDGQTLWKEFRSQKKPVFLVDMDQEENYCPALITTTKVAHRCRKPAMLGQTYCPEHEFFVMPNEFKHKPQVQRIETDEQPLFIDTLTQQIYTRDYERIGYIQKNKCIVFEVVD